MKVTKQFVDVGHTVEHGLVTYQWLPAPVISDYLGREESRKHYAEETEFHIGKIEMVANTGTGIVNLKRWRCTTANLTT